MTASQLAMRRLVACGGCRRQFDVAGFAAGSTFHCSCGTAIEVPEFKPHAATVVRCSSCGAPRDAGRRSCAHCAADFTAIEQDLNTICPSCMTVVSDRARFCHNCATAILAQDLPARPTSSRCPACGKRQRLNSRDLGEPPVSVLECPACAGLWLDDASFRLVADGARSAAADTASAAGIATGTSRSGGARPGGPLYRRCPTCDQMMHRHNFGRLSGVIVDTCKTHGIWFDARELEAVLGWIRGGGESIARRREEHEERAAERREALRYDRAGRSDGVPPGELSGWGRSDDVFDVVTLFRRLFDL